MPVYRIMVEFEADDDAMALHMENTKGVSLETWELLGRDLNFVPNSLARESSYYVPVERPAADAK